MPETRAQATNQAQAPNANNMEEQIEPYKLSEIFSLIPEFEGDQISLGTFLNACDCANEMAIHDQKRLLVIFIKNKLRGRAAQLINSRNPSSYAKIKQLLNLHFGDSRDLSSLIQDLQRLKQIQGESPLTFFNRLQVLHAKMLANIQKTSTLNYDEKGAQCSLIDTMTLNTLLTGLEPRLGQIIRAGNPKDLPEAHIRIRRELQLSYFETQKVNKPMNTPVRPVLPNRRPPTQTPKCYKCGRLGHFANECRSQSMQNFPQRNPNYQSNGNFQNNNFPNNSNFQKQTPPQTQSNTYNSSRSFTTPQQNQTQYRPSVIQRNPNFQSNQRTYHINQNSQYYQNDPYQYGDNSYNDYNDNDVEQLEYYVPEDQTSYENFEPLDNTSYQNFLSLPNQNHPPNNVTPSTDPLQEVQNQIQTLNLDDMNPMLNFPEQRFL